MRHWALAITLVVAVVPGSAAAQSLSMTGEVVDSESFWAYGGKTIVTVTTVRNDAGVDHRLFQLGGKVGDIRVVLSHSPAIPTVGERITAVMASRTLRSGERVFQLLDVTARSAGKSSETQLPFVQTTAPGTGAPLHWAANCVVITFDTDGTSHVAGSDEFAVMNSVLQTWQAGFQSCSYMTLAKKANADQEIGLDGVNLIIFRDSEWCRPETDTTPAVCHNASAFAITTLAFIDDNGSSRNGEILDADIEMNGVNFDISVNGITTQPPGGCLGDLANTLTHEVGHLLGLDHTCWSSPPATIDGNGNPTPQCGGGLASEITEATMFASQRCGEEKKQTLEADDINGICDIYPIAADPGECFSPEVTTCSCCCRVAPAPAAPENRKGWLVLSLLFMATIVRLRR